MTIQPTSDSREHITDITLSLSHLGKQLPEMRGLTAAGDLQRALEANAQSVVNYASRVAAERAGQEAQSRIEASYGWFERNV